MITKPEEAFRMMGSPHGMSTKQTQRLMQRHLKEWRPKEYAELVESDNLLPETLKAAEKVQKGIRSLMDSGTPFHEAQETMLKRYILLAPEPEMIAEMEKD